MEGKDLTKGNLLKNMFILLIPLVLTNLLNSIYNIVDGIFVGNLIGENGLSAITNCYPIVFVITATIQGPAIATSVLVSQYYGAKAEEKLKSVCGVAYTITTILGLVLAILITITSDFWLKVLDTPVEILDMSKQYIIIYSIGSIFNAILIIIMEALRATGNSKVPLFFVGITTIVNLILDFILIKIGLGVAGAGIATMIAMFIGMITVIMYLNRKNSILRINKKYLKLDINYMKKILKIGIPIVLEELFAVIGLSLEINTVNRDGIIAIAAYGVADKLIQAIYVIGLSFQTMGTVTTGQFIGKKKIKECIKVVKNGIKLSILPCILIFTVVFIFPRQFCRIFVTSEIVIKFAINYISIIGIIHVLSPIKQLIQGFIAGTGHTKILFYSMTIANIIEIASILILRKTNLTSLTIIGIGIFLWLITDLGINLIYFFSENWKKQVIEN